MALDEVSNELSATTLFATSDSLSGDIFWKTLLKIGRKLGTQQQMTPNKAPSTERRPRYPLEKVKSGESTK